MSRREIAFRDLKETKKLDIIPYQEHLRDQWDTFVWGSNNGTLFHTRKFLNYHPEDRFLDHSLVFAKDKKWLAVLPAASRTDGQTRQLISHPGLSFAGPAFDSSLSIRDTFRFTDALIEFAYRNDFAQITLTLAPQVYYWRPSNYLEFALLQSGFTYRKREVSSVIPLDFAEEDVLMVFNSESARAVRKAMKSGVTARESKDFSDFYAILKKNLKLRHNVEPTHTLEELHLLADLFPRRIRLFEAVFADQVIAGIVVFVCNARVALAFYVSHNERMQELRGVNFLFYYVIRWAIRQNLKFLDFGIFTVNMNPNWGLARFKESFGAQGIFRDTLIKVL